MPESQRNPRLISSPAVSACGFAPHLPGRTLEGGAINVDKWCCEASFGYPSEILVQCPFSRSGPVGRSPQFHPFARCLLDPLLGRVGLSALMLTRPASRLNHVVQSRLPICHTHLGVGLGLLVAESLSASRRHGCSIASLSACSRWQRPVPVWIALQSTRSSSKAPELTNGSASEAAALASVLTSLGQSDIGMLGPVEVCVDVQGERFGSTAQKSPCGVRAASGYGGA